MKKLLLLIIAILGIAVDCMAQNEVSTVYVGGHIRRERPGTITKLRDSGFGCVILFNVHVDTDGTLITDGETICKDGKYVFDKTQPYYVSDVKKLKEAPTGITRIEICIGGWGNDSYAHIKSLISKEGTGTSSILYKNFKALKDMIPEIDAVNDDQEQDYDATTTINFHKMMYKLGYKTTIAPYTNKTFWQSVCNGLKSYGLDRIMIQCYDGGAGNTNYAKDWQLLPNVPLHAGLLNYGNDWNMDTNRKQFETWRDNHNVKGGFVWVYNDETWDLHEWATSINRIYKAKNTPVEEAGVQFFDATKFGGYSAYLPEGHYGIGELALYGFKDKTLRSFKVMDGYQVTLHKSKNFTGVKKTFTGEYERMPTGYGGITLSIDVEKIPDGIAEMKNEEVIETYYDINGVEKQSLSRGINIIRMSDGTTKKVVVR